MPASNNKFKVIFSVIVLLFITYMVVYIIVINLDPNPISLNYNLSYKHKIKSLFPQGWAFFTKDVREEEGITLYKVGKGQIIELVDLNSFTLDDFLGLKRKNRVIGHKLTLASNSIPTNKWFSFKGSIENIPLDSLKQFDFKIKRPNIKGVFIMKKGKQLPYQWYTAKKKIFKTYNYTLIKVE